MQNAFEQHHNHSKTWMQQGNMRLHAKPSKFHIEHAQNGTTVQQYKIQTQSAQNNI